MTWFLKGLSLLENPKENRMEQWLYSRTYTVIFGIWSNSTRIIQLLIGNSNL